jgi:hypothetical protein
MLETWVMNSEPVTSLMSQEQLIAVLQGIYDSLVAVETGCIEVDNKQTILAQADPGMLLSSYTDLRQSLCWAI